MTTVVLRRTDLNEMQKMRTRVQILHFDCQWISTDGTLAQ